jgi:hypothetical protein
MEQLTQQKSVDFIDRRQDPSDRGSSGPERRQFSNSHDSLSLSPDVAELAEAVDQYKLLHRQRFITFEELFDVVSSLGYHK